MSETNPQLECMFFSKLPIELRNVMYRDVLVSTNLIISAHELVGKQRSIMRDNQAAGIQKHMAVEPIDDICATMLRTCRCVY